MTANRSQVSTRSDRFQQWTALLGSRTRRQRTGAFLVQGVRPITVAVERGWPVRTVLCPVPAPRPPSGWAQEIRARLAGVETVGVAPELLAELGEKDAIPELLLLAELPPDLVERIPTPPDALVVVADRPANPGNLGTLVRSADAFGAHGVVVTGHAADPYDPRALRASTGSLLAVPVVRLAGTDQVLQWRAELAARGVGARIVGADEGAELGIAQADLTGPTLLVVGNEGRGLSRAWRDACDLMVSIPIRPPGRSAASSLNMATAGTVALYEAARQRGAAGPR